MHEDTALAVTLSTGRNGKLNVQSQHKISGAAAADQEHTNNPAGLGRSGWFLEEVCASSCQGI